MHKDIVDKALKGEDYQEEVKDFDETQLKDLDIEIGKAAKVEADSELARVSALRKEKQRLSGVPLEKKDDVQSQLREENIQLAKEEFFADEKFKLSDDEKVQFDSEFKKLDSGKIAPKLILGDLKKAYASIKSESLLENQDKMTEYERNAALHNADMAGGSGGQGTPDESKFTQAAKDLHKSWLKQGIKGKTLEDAQKLADRGGEWRERNLA